MKWILSLLLSLAPANGLRASPAESVAAAAADIQKVPPHNRKYIRYQSLYPHAADKIATFLKVHSFQLNSLSRSPNLKKSSDCLVTPTLLRIDLRDYKWDVAVYEKLADVEPYYHMPVIELGVKEETAYVEKEWQGGVWEQEGPDKGKYFPKGAFKYKEKVVTKVPDGTQGKPFTAAAFWIDPVPYKLLSELTESRVPIVRADWFLVQTGINEERVAGYYAFLGLKSRDDFFKLIGFDEELARKGAREVAAIVKVSGVARLSRQIYRFGARDFGYWQTRDAFFRSAGNRNALNALNGDYKHQAERHYGFLLNGMFAYYLSDNAGKQQDAAPPQIGPDTTVTTEAGDAIHVFRSCVTCHVEGLRPIKDWSRTTFTGTNLLSTFDEKDPEKAKEKFERLKQLYLQPLERWYRRDNADFAQTLADLNGADWTPAKNAVEYGRMWDAAANAEVTTELAAVELGGGVTAKSLVEALTKYNTPKAEGGLGQALPPSVVELKKGGSMLREHFDEAYPLLQSVVRGITFPDVVKGAGK